MNLRAVIHWFTCIVWYFTFVRRWLLVEMARVGHMRRAASPHLASRSAFPPGWTPPSTAPLDEPSLDRLLDPGSPPPPLLWADIYPIRHLPPGDKGEHTPAAALICPEPRAPFVKRLGLKFETDTVAPLASSLRAKRLTLGPFRRVLTGGSSQAGPRVSTAPPLFGGGAYLNGLSAGG